MGRSERRLSEELESFTTKWQHLAELMSQAVVKQQLTPAIEKEYLLLTGELMRNSVHLASSLGLEKRFVQQVADLLGDAYNLRILAEMQDFQITLLRERWNAVLIEINSASAK